MMIIIIVMKMREGSNPQKNKCCTVQLLPPAAQPLPGSSPSPCWAQQPWFAVSLGPAQLSCPGHAPSQLLLHLLAGMGHRGVLDLERAQ